MTQPTHGLDPNALEAARKWPDLAAIEAAARKVNPGRSEDHIKSVALDALSIIRALSQNPGTSNTSGEAGKWHDIEYLMNVIDAAIEDGFDPDEDGPLLDEIRAEVKAGKHRLAALEPRASDRERTIEECVEAVRQCASLDENGYIAEKSAAIAAIRKLSEVSQANTATHRHVKRGTEYLLIGYGKMQTQEWYEDDRDVDYRPVANTVDMREVAIYRSVDDGSLWVRPREEFEDGRFIKLSEVSHEH